MKARNMLGEFIQKRRKLMGLSVKDAASQWGLTTSAIYMIERGDRVNLTADTWEKLSRGLGVPIAELMALRNESTRQEVAT